MCPAGGTNAPVAAGSTPCDERDVEAAAANDERGLALVESTACEVDGATEVFDGAELVLGGALEVDGGAELVLGGAEDVVVIAHGPCDRLNCPLQVA